MLVGAFSFVLIMTMSRDRKQKGSPISVKKKQDKWVMREEKPSLQNIRELVDTAVWAWKCCWGESKP